MILKEILKAIRALIMNKMLNLSLNGTYPHLFGMLFGYRRNNLNIRIVYPTTVKGQVS
jgi:hypothetical protein